MGTIQAIPLPNNSPPLLLLTVAWQASAFGEGHDDQHIMYSTSNDLGGTWTLPTTIAKGITYHKAVWGPVLWYPPTSASEPPSKERAPSNILYLFYSESTPEEYRAPNRSYPGGNIMLQYGTF